MYSIKHAREKLQFFDSWLLDFNKKFEMHFKVTKIGTQLELIAMNSYENTFSKTDSVAS